MTTRECADALDVPTGWICDAINVGVIVNGRRVWLQAEPRTWSSRIRHRIDPNRFRTFLIAIGRRPTPTG